MGIAITLNAITTIGVFLYSILTIKEERECLIRINGAEVTMLLSSLIIMNYPDFFNGSDFTTEIMIWMALPLIWIAKIPSIKIIPLPIISMTPAERQEDKLYR